MASNRGRRKKKIQCNFADSHVSYWDQEKCQQPQQTTEASRVTREWHLFRQQRDHGSESQQEKQDGCLAGWSRIRTGRGEQKLYGCSHLFCCEERQQHGTGSRWGCLGKRTVTYHDLKGSGDILDGCVLVAIVQ